MIVCGIDPGLNGAVSFIHSDSKYIQAEKAPVFRVNIGKKQKRFLDMWSLNSILADQKPEHVFIEKQQAMPRQGVSSTFRTGFGYGLYIGMLIAGDYDYTIVGAKEWKKFFNLSSDKDLSREKASVIFPDASHMWRQKNQDGLAEAALIAYFGANGSQVLSSWEQ